MARSIAAVLESVRVSIEAASSGSVALGTPSSSEGGLWLFPYRFAESAFARSALRRDSSNANDRSYVLHCLLIANPPEDFAALDDGMKWLADGPDLDSEVATLRVTPSELATDELTRLFEGARLSLRLAIPLELVWTAR